MLVQQRETLTAQVKAVVQRAAWMLRLSPVAQGGQDHR